MVTKRVGLVLVAAAMAMGGCGIGLQSVRQMAARDLRCPSNDVRATALPEGAYRAEGCGRQAYYLDDNVFTPSTNGTSTAVWRYTGRTASR